MILSDRSHVDLCAGAGGLALGCAAAGFETVALYERDSRSCATLRHNVARGLLSGTVVEADVSRIRWQQPSGTLSLLSAGLPCQPFSVAGAHKAIVDERNLFPELFRAIRCLRPLVVLVENVPGLMRPRFKDYFEYILAQLSMPQSSPLRGEDWRRHFLRLTRELQAEDCEPDYFVQWRILNSADFGVPQIRRRLFLVATSRELGAFSFPRQSHSRYPLDPGSSKPEGGGPFDWRSAQHARSEEPKPWISVKEALEGLPEATPHAASPVANHFPIDGARSYPRHLPSVMHLPAKTVKAGVHGVAGGENTVSVAGGGVRYFTLRELARLQTFPDSYEFLGPRSSIVRQIGNAVCCALAEELAAGALALIEQHYSAGKRRAI